MIHVKLVEEVSELSAIRSLQEENLRKNIDDSEASSQGFVSAEYSTDFLYFMHQLAPSIIACDDSRVVGYALVTLRDAAHLHPLLDDLFNTIDRTTYRGALLQQASYVVVGQLCVAKKYRGQGLVQKMYNAFRDQYSRTFEYCITDVATANPRSLQAHLKVGFVVVDTLQYGGISWDIVLWDWRKRGK